MILESTRLQVRQFTIADAEVFYQMNSDPEIVRYIRDPQNREEAMAFLREKINAYSINPAYGSWAITHKPGTTVIGTFMIRPSFNVQGAIEMGYSFFSPYWGKGYATEIVKAGLHYAFADLLLPSIIAITDRENRASQKVLLKCGFIQSGNLQEAGKPASYLFTIENTLHG